MIEVSVTIEVDLDPAAVFAYWAEWSNNPQWQKGMERCEWTSEPPLRLGSTYDQHARFLRRPIVSSFEVVEFEPDRLLRIRATKSTLPLDITRRVEPGQAGGTVLQALIKGEPAGLMKLFNSLTARMVRSNVEADYARLKELLNAMA